MMLKKNTGDNFVTALSSSRLENLLQDAIKCILLFLEPKDLEGLSLASKTTRIALDSFFLERVVVTSKIFPEKQVALWKEDIKNLTFSTYETLAQRASQFLIGSVAFDMPACNAAKAKFNNSIFKAPVDIFFKKICLEKEFARVALLEGLERSAGLLRLTQQLVDLDLLRAEALLDNMEEHGEFHCKSQAIELIIKAYLSKAHRANLEARTRESLLFLNKAESFIDSLTFSEEQKQAFREVATSLRVADTKEIDLPHFLRRLPPVNNSSWI